MNTKFAPLSYCEVHSLVKLAHINGKMAHILSYDVERELYKVIVDGKRYAIKESNLKRSEYTPETVTRYGGAPVQKKGRLQTVRTTRGMNGTFANPYGGKETVCVVPAVQQGAGRRVDRHLKDRLPWQHGPSQDVEV